MQQKRQRDVEVGSKLRNSRAPFLLLYPHPLPSSLLPESLKRLCGKDLARLPIPATARGDGTCIAQTVQIRENLDAMISSYNEGGLVDV